MVVESRSWNEDVALSNDQCVQMLSHKNAKNSNAGPFLQDALDKPFQAAMGIMPRMGLEPDQQQERANAPGAIAGPMATVLMAAAGMSGDLSD